MRTNRSMSSCVLGALGLFLAGSVGALTPTAEADTLVVPDAYPTIQDAIDAAQEGDEVVIQPGIYNETFNYNGKGITVRSAEGPLMTRIDRNGAGGTVVTANGTPAGARLEGIGFYVAGGIMLDCDNAQLTCDNCRFVGCSTEPITIDGAGSVVNLSRAQIVLASARARIGSGTVIFTESAIRNGSNGGLKITGGSVSMDAVDFQNNSSYAAGAIDIDGDPVVSISNSDFTNNTVSVRGGAISAQGGFDLSVQQTRFLGHSASLSPPCQNGADNSSVLGGTVYLQGGVSSFVDCQMDASFAGKNNNCNNQNYGAQGQAQGGALYAQSCLLALRRVHFSDCRSYRYQSNNLGGRADGGALYADGCDLLLDECSFSNCFTEYIGPGVATLGGSIYANSCNVSITDVDLDSCRDPRGQQACFFAASGQFEASGLLLSDCDGFQIDSPQIGYDQSMVMSGSQFIRSDTLRVTSADGRDFHMSDCLFDGMGGEGFGSAVSIHSMPQSAVSITNTSFVNLSEPNGSAIDTSETELVIAGSLFSSNVAPSIDIGVTARMPFVASSTFCGSYLDEIDGPWVDKGGNVFDSPCDIDCDQDGLPDEYEIQSGLDSDCNGNGLPDSCEGLLDCDGDGILDECAIANGAPDCDGNGIPDNCQADCDGDGYLDVCEIAEGATDCNKDGVPDDCQLALGLLEDFNNDGTPDVCQTLDFTGLDTEIVLIEDRILDSAIPATAVCYRLYATFDPDSVGGAQLLGVYGNADSPLSIASKGGFWQDDIGGNTSAGVLCDPDVNFPDLRYDSWLTIEKACIADNLLVEAGIDWAAFNAGGSLLVDDGGVFLYPEDAQGVPGLDGRILIAQVTSIDGTLPSGSVNLLGQNADGSDWQAFGITWPVPPLVDCNGNGIHDAYDLADGTSRDCDGSGLPDECEYDTTNDCNENGIDDLCDVADGTSGDADGDFVPDECECQGDANRDGVVNVEDIIAVILAWGSSDPDPDVNDDGTVDSIDLTLVLGGFGACL